MLQPDASWGDRGPHGAMEQIAEMDVKMGKAS
jgi:hypothetical protein